MANTTDNSEKKDPNNTAGKTAGSLACTALGAAGVPIPPAVGAAVGGVVQGIVRGILNFFKNKKKEGNKEVIDALEKGGADADKIDVTTGEVTTPQNDKKIIYIIGGLVAVVVIYYLVKKK
jgi:phage tail tape-measure protein